MHIGFRNSKCKTSSRVQEWSSKELLLWENVEQIVMTVIQFLFVFKLKGITFHDTKFLECKLESSYRNWLFLFICKRLMNSFYVILGKNICKRLHRILSIFARDWGIHLTHLQIPCTLYRVSPKSGTLDFHYFDIKNYSIFWIHQIKHCLLKRMIPRSLKLLTSFDSVVISQDIVIVIFSSFSWHFSQG